MKSGLLLLLLLLLVECVNNPQSRHLTVLQKIHHPENRDPLPTPAIASSTFQFLKDRSFLSSTKMPAACNNLQDALSNYLYPSVALKLN